MPMERAVAEDVLTGKVAVIGSRTDDPGRRPIAGSTPSPCSECGRDVMLSIETRARMTELSVVLCTDCALAVAEARGTPWIDTGRTGAQLREMEANGIEPRRFYVKNPNYEPLG